MTSDWGLVARLWGLGNLFPVILCFTGNIDEKGYYSADFFCKTFSAIAYHKVERGINGYGNTAFKGKHSFFSTICIDFFLGNGTMQIEFTVAQKTTIQKTLGVMTQGLLYWL